MATVHDGNFEWDDAKAASNKKKHKVSFEEAVTAFYDEHSLIVDDPQGNEGRFVLIGLERPAFYLWFTRKRSRRSELASSLHGLPKRARRYAIR